MEYQGYKISTRVAGMEGYEASIVNAEGRHCGKVYSRESEDLAIAAAREFIDKKLS
jgi:hypothetical protein